MRSGISAQEMKRAFTVLAALAAFGTGSEISGQQTPATDISRGAGLFADRCASCHGEGAIGRAELFDVRMTDYARLP